MADQKIIISGKCTSDDIATCEFRIRKVGAVIRAKGQRELADAIEQAANRLRKARAKEPVRMEDKAEMEQAIDWDVEACIKFSDFYPIYAYGTIPLASQNPGSYQKLQWAISEVVSKYPLKREARLKDKAGIEARESLTVTDPVIGGEHNVSIPLSCPGTQPVSPELAKALTESEEV